MGQILFEEVLVSTYGYGEATQGGNEGAYGDKLDFDGMFAAMASPKYKYAKVKVTNLANNKSIVVKIVDTGPFATNAAGTKPLYPLREHPTRKLDLVRGAWKAITNGAKPGIIKAKLELLESNVDTGVTANGNNPINQAVNTAGSLATNAGQSVINGINSIGAGIQSALLTGQNCPPPAYTQQDRIIYPGCLNKGSNPIFGNSLGSGPSAPAINAIGTAGNKPVPTQAATKSEPYTGSLKPGGFIACMKKGTYTVTSNFGWRWGKMHKGIDLAASIGTPIYAAADGVVSSTVTGCPINGFYGSGCGGGYGNQILISHQGASTMYAHLSSVLVKEGDKVKQGQLIGKIGNSGSSTGAHTHHEIRLSNKGAVDPTTFVKF